MSRSVPHLSLCTMIASLLVVHAGRIQADDPYATYGYGNSGNPYSRGFSDIGQGGWVNDEPQFRPLDAAPASPSPTQNGYRPDTPAYGSGGHGGPYTNPGYGGYPAPEYGASPNASAPYGSGRYGTTTYPRAPYGNPTYGNPGFAGSGYPDPAYPGASYPGQRYPDPAYGRSGYHEYPVAPDEAYLPSSRYPDAYTPPPVIDWSRSLPRPAVSLEDFPLPFAPGEGLGASAPQSTIDPRLPYELPYRTESFPPASIPPEPVMSPSDRFSTGNPQAGGSLIDNMLGKARRDAAPQRYPQIDIPPAPPRDVIPPLPQPDSRWTPPGQDGFRPLTAEERADWGTPGASHSGDGMPPRAPAEPHRYYVPSPDFNERLQESARAFENRVGNDARETQAIPHAIPQDSTPTDPYARPPLPLPESRPDATPAQPAPLTAPLFIVPMQSEAASPLQSAPASNHDDFGPDTANSTTSGASSDPIPTTIDSPGAQSASPASNEAESSTIPTHRPKSDAEPSAETIPDPLPETTPAPAPANDALPPRVKSSAETS
ncbi:MAG: hypothetical protein H6981_12185 [Gammaproteobacteria bacterium]|nr:hypothetical protein [Gammaproteobacteria bacterium]MCP5137548.1 hypothetical protein [Gammaproteobacteria bacterium]